MLVPPLLPTMRYVSHIQSIAQCKYDSLIVIMKNEHWTIWYWKGERYKISDTVINLNKRSNSWFLAKSSEVAILKYHMKVQTKKMQTSDQSMLIHKGIPLKFSTLTGKNCSEKTW